MKIPTLEDLVLSGFLPDDSQLFDLVSQASVRTDAILVACDIPNRQYDYVSPACQLLTGYAEGVYFKDGLNFIFTRIAPKSLLSMALAQVKYLLHTKKLGFDPREVIVQEFSVAFKTATGRVKAFTTLGMPLTYSTQMDHETVLGMICENNPATVAICRALLIAVKQRHNELVLHKQSPRRKEPLVKLYIQKMLDEGLSAREEEVLKPLLKARLLVI